MIKSPLSILITTALCTSLQAGGNVVEESAIVEPIVEATPTVENSIYLGIAYSTLKLHNDLTNEEFKANSSMMLQAGYQYGSFVALEGRYTTSLGAVDYSHGDIVGRDIDDFDTDFSTLAIYIKPIYPIAHFNIYALLGYASTTLTNLNGADRSVNGLSWGLGAEYKFTTNISAFVDYINLYDDNDLDGLGTDADHKIDSFNVGVSYRF